MSFSNSKFSRSLSLYLLQDASLKETLNSDIYSEFLNDH